MQVRYLDDRVQLRGPFVATASEEIVKEEAKLKKMEKNIGPDRAKELKNLITSE